MTQGSEPATETCARCNQPVDDHAEAVLAGTNRYLICPTPRGYAVSETAVGSGVELEVE